MKTKLIFSAVFIVQCLVVYAQAEPSNFMLYLVNNSGYTTHVTIPGNDKVDSVSAQQEKTIIFYLEKDQPAFYLDLWTEDRSSSSFKNIRIRILNEQSSKQLTITPTNQLIYLLSPSEKIIADYNPQLRSKNFWKLDTVIKKNANNIAAADIIFLSICDIDVKVDTIRKYYNFLSTAVKSSAYGKRIEAYLEARNRLKIGNKITEIKIPDTTGRIISLDQINSDYVLLDFWYSRCGPCIKSFPALQELYKKTDRKKFEIVGISIDRANEQGLWKATINKYGLPWINLHDAKSSIVSHLAIANYPTRVLVDRSGKILMVDTDNSFESFYHEIEKLVNAN